jgi:signal transduction histidine kinase
MAYVVATLLALAATGITLCLIAQDPDFHFVGSVMAIAILLVAFGWGAAPCLYATLLGVPLIWYVLLVREVSWAVADPTDAFGLLLFAVLGLALCALSSLNEQQRRQLAAQARALAMAQERAESESQRLRAVLDAMPSAVLITGPQGQSEEYNEANRTLWGGDVPLVQQMADYAVLKAWWPETGQPVDPDEWVLPRALRSGGAQLNDEVEIEALPGQHKRILVSAVPMRDAGGTLIGAVVNAQDITELRRLEREVAESAKQLDQFFAMASHDIRSPVTALTGQVQIAHLHAQRLAATLQTYDGQTADRTAPLLGALDRADESGERLQRLVPLLFDVARARSGTLTLKLAPCELAALVHEQVTAQQAAVPGRTIHLDLPEHPVQVEADEDRLGEVLTNYLTNALKYSSDGQPVGVRLAVTEGRAVVSVMDHGPGLSEDEQSHVWELYHRAPGVEVQGRAGTSTGSLGMGLHICKRLIELHPGGAVGVDSRVGEGSTFWFSLPRTPAAP